MKLLSCYMSMLFAFTLFCCQEAEERKGWVKKEPAADSLYGGHFLATYSFAADNSAYVAALNTATSKLDWWKYSPPSNQWAKQESFPLIENRFHTLSTSDNATKGYAGLGITRHESSSGEITLTAHNDIWEFNARIQKWEQLPDFPGMNKMAYGQPPVAFIVSDIMYVLSSGYSELWALDLESRSWSKRTAPPLQPEHQLQAAKAFQHAHAGFLIISKPGYPTNKVNVFQYQPDSDEWSVVLEDTTDLDLTQQALFVLRDHLFLGSRLWKKYDLPSMTNSQYFWGVPDATPNYTYPAVAGFQINNTGYVLFTNREFWQYIPE
jgi:hypothetical protein